MNNIFSAIASVCYQQVQFNLILIVLVWRNYFVLYSKASLKIKLSCSDIILLHEPTTLTLRQICKYGCSYQFTDWLYHIKPRPHHHPLAPAVSLSAWTVVIKLQCIGDRLTKYSVIKKALKSLLHFNITVFSETAVQRWFWSLKTALVSFVDPLQLIRAR